MGKRSDSPSFYAYPHFMLQCPCDVYYSKKLCTLFDYWVQRPCYIRGNDACVCSKRCFPRSSAVSRIINAVTVDHRTWHTFASSERAVIKPLIKCLATVWRLPHRYSASRYNTIWRRMILPATNSKTHRSSVQIISDSIFYATHVALQIQVRCLSSTETITLRPTTCRCYAVMPNLLTQKSAKQCVKLDLKCIVWIAETHLAAGGPVGAYSALQT